MNSFPIKTSIHKGFSYLLGPHLILAGVREDVAVVQSGSRGPQAQRGVNGGLFFPFSLPSCPIETPCNGKGGKGLNWDPCQMGPLLEGSLPDLPMEQFQRRKLNFSCFFSFSFLVLWTNLFLHHPQKCKTMVSDRAPLKERYPLFLSKAKTYHVDGGSYVYNAWWIMCVSKFD